MCFGDSVPRIISFNQSWPRTLRGQVKAPPQDLYKLLQPRFHCSLFLQDVEPKFIRDRETGTWPEWCQKEKATIPKRSWSLSCILGRRTWFLLFTLNVKTLEWSFVTKTWVHAWITYKKGKHDSYHVTTWARITDFRRYLYLAYIFKRNTNRSFSKLLLFHLILLSFQFINTVIIYLKMTSRHKV